METRGENGGGESERGGKVERAKGGTNTVKRGIN